MPIDFGTPKQKALERALHEYAQKSEDEDVRYTDTHLYCGFTVNIHFFGFTQQSGSEQQIGQLDFLSETKAFFWSHDWKLPEAVRKIIEEHGYTIETDFWKLSKHEKAQLGYEE